MIPVGEPFVVGDGMTVHDDEVVAPSAFPVEERGCDMGPVAIEEGILISGLFEENVLWNVRGEASVYENSVIDFDMAGLFEYRAGVRRRVDIEQFKDGFFVGKVQKSMFAQMACPPLVSQR